MKNIFEKLKNKILPFVLCICIVSGAAAPAYAATTNADTAAQKLFDLYWSTSSNPSGQNGTWYGVVRILLKDIYDRLESVWSDQRNLWTYNSTSYSLWNFSNNSNLSQSYYISNGAGPVSWLLNSMANLSQNTGYVANQFYNSNSNFNKAMSAMVSLNSNFQDYTSILNNIKTDTANLSGIKTDTANLSGIKTDTANLSGIKTDTANLSGIKTDTSNLSGIKTDTANLSGIKSDIETFNNDFNNIDWISVGNYLGTKKDSLDSNYLSSDAAGTTFYGILNIPDGYSIFNVRLPLYAVPYTMSYPIDVSIGYTYGQSYDIDYYVLSTHADRSGLYITFYLEPKANYGLNYYIKVYNRSGFQFVNNPAVIQSISYDKKDFYDVSNYVQLDNIVKLFKQAKEVFFDDATLAAKKANQANEDSFLNGFTGSGSASASPSDFGAVKDSIVDFKAGFSGGASSSDTFSFIAGDSNAWDWFTQETANDLDRTQGNNTRLLRGSSDVAYDTPLLDSYYSSILSILGGE